MSENGPSEQSGIGPRSPSSGNLYKPPAPGTTPRDVPTSTDGNVPQQVQQQRPPGTTFVAAHPKIQNKYKAQHSHHNSANGQGSPGTGPANTGGFSGISPRWEWGTATATAAAGAGGGSGGAVAAGTAAPIKNTLRQNGSGGIPQFTPFNAGVDDNRKNMFFTMRPGKNVSFNGFKSQVPQNKSQDDMRIDGNAVYNGNGNNGSGFYQYQPQSKQQTGNAGGSFTPTGMSNGASYPQNGNSFSAPQLPEMSGNANMNANANANRNMNGNGEVVPPVLVQKTSYFKFTLNE